MGTILQVLGILALVLLGGVVLLVVGWKVVAAKLGKALSQLGNMGIGPATITLQSTTTPPSPLLAARVAALEALGMQHIGTYLIPEMPGVTMVALQHSQHRAYGVAYQHPQAGVWSDVYARYADAGGLTVSNAPMGGMLDPMPGWLKIYDKAANEAELMRRFLQERAAQAPLRAVSAELFPAEFQDAYRLEMEWRSGRGGATMDEIQRVANATPGRFDAATVAAAREVIEADARGKVVETIRRKVAGTMDGSSWESMRDRVMILHANMTAEDAREVLEEATAHGALTPDDVTAFEARLDGLMENKTHVLNWPAQLATALPEAARFTVLQQLDDPVAAVVLVRPAG